MTASAMGNEDAPPFLGLPEFIYLLPSQLEYYPSLLQLCCAIQDASTLLSCEDTTTEGKELFFFYSFCETLNAHVRLGSSPCMLRRVL